MIVAFLKVTTFLFLFSNNVGLNLKPQANKTDAPSTEHTWLNKYKLNPETLLYTIHKWCARVFGFHVAGFNRLP